MNGLMEEGGTGLLDYWIYSEENIFNNPSIHYSINPRKLSKYLNQLQKGAE
jgi:hypothetical protein